MGYLDGFRQSAIRLRYGPQTYCSLPALVFSPEAWVPGVYHRPPLLQGHWWVRAGALSIGPMTSTWVEDV